MLTKCTVVTDSVIVYHSPMEQQTAEMVSYAYQSGDMIWFWGIILAILIGIAIAIEYSKRR